MKFVKVPDLKSGASYLVSDLSNHLSNGDKVAWFLSGGSNIAIEIAVLEMLKISNQSNLRVLLVDERYGEHDHEDSNLFQLRQASANPSSLSVVEVLQNPVKPFIDTVKDYNQKVKEVFGWADYTIGQFGMGKDGHTSGILPGSVATKPTEDFVIGYQADDYQRITTTFEAIRRLSVAYVFAFGSDKLGQLNKLHDENVDPSIQPAQIFKQVKEAYIINDAIED